MEIIKRDGRRKQFEGFRIEDAVNKAFKEVYGEDSFAGDIGHNTHVYVLRQLNGKNNTGIEKVQDLVVEYLMTRDKKVGKAYKDYREKRTIARKKKTYEDFSTIVNTIANEITRENANMNADTPAGMMMKFASETTKQFVDDVLLSEDVKAEVMHNRIHPHDKDYYPTKSLTCLQHPLDRLLNNGFRAGHGSSRPAKRIETASMIGCISLESIQNEMHGGQAIPAWDFYMSPYVRLSYIEEIKKIEEFIEEDLSHLYHIEIEDYIEKTLKGLGGDKRYVQQAINKTVSRTHQSMESFIHNMNTIHSRGGNQVVFSSINYGTDTSPEGRCVIREMLLSTYKGVGNGETPIFPIQIWKKKRGVNYNPEDRNYDLYKLACKVTAKRFFPNFINLDATFNKSDKWEENDPNRYLYECSTMGCRTRVFEDIFGESTSVGRGNLSFTTVNIVRLALESKINNSDKDQMLNEFYTRLENTLDIVAKQLHERFLFQATASAKQFPMLMSGMWNGSDRLKPESNISDVIKTGTLGVGFIGLAECLIVLTGKHHGESEESQKLGLKIVKFMNKKCEEYKKLYNHNYSVLATPAEGISGKFTKVDAKEFGEIEHVTDKEYYTNSNHVPVWYKCTVKHKAEVEAPYHDLTRGGHIFYVELDGDATHNPESIMRVVDYMDKYNIGYGSINHTRSRCLDCGFENSDGELKVCPICNGNNIDIIQRITGYLVGSVGSWNAYKKAELKDRVTHS